jgi:hypothetical protein
MMPAPHTPGWSLMILPPTRFSRDKLARVKVVDGAIVQAFAVEGAPATPGRRLHWAEGVGGWESI